MKSGCKTLARPKRLSVGPPPPYIAGRLSSSASSSHAGRSPMRTAATQKPSAMHTAGSDEALSALLTKSKRRRRVGLAAIRAQLDRDISDRVLGGPAPALERAIDHPRLPGACAVIIDESVNRTAVHREDLVAELHPWSFGFRMEVDGAPVCVAQVERRPDVFTVVPHHIEGVVRALPERGRCEKKQRGQAHVGPSMCPQRRARRGHVSR